MKFLITFMTFTLLASCSIFQRLRSNLNDQVVIGKEQAPARTPASVGLPYQLDSKSHKSVDNEFQKEITEKVRTHLEALIADIEDSLDDVEAVERAMVDLDELDKELKKASGGKARIRKIVPKGMAQDIETRKHKVHRGNK